VVNRYSIVSGVNGGETLADVQVFVRSAQASRSFRVSSSRRRGGATLIRRQRG